MGTPPPKGNPELKNFLNVSRVITLLWLVIAGIVALVDVVLIIIGLLHLTFPTGDIFGLVYAVIWGLTDLLILGHFGHWNTLAEEGQLTTLQQDLLLWVILGIIFGVIPGLLLALIYLRLGGPKGGFYFEHPASTAPPPPETSTPPLPNAPTGTAPPPPPPANP